MTTPPDRNLAACMRVLYYAILEARSLAWENHGKRDKPIADVMDAVHNIPLLVTDWQRCRPEMIRDFLLAYDEKWNPPVRLAGVYDAAIARGDADEKPSLQ
jgi:hypothetical protein